ncbi:MAG: TMEM175 family protein [Gammaproteobacteria bacterium]
MKTSRLEAFSDGVIAIIITIMVLGLSETVGKGAGWNALRPVVPVFLSYVLSFIYVGIYWSNHHHMLNATGQINGGILQRSIIAHNGRTSKLAQAIGHDTKGKLSTVAYALGIGLAFVNSWVANGIFLLVALMWLVPDRRIESRIAE